MTGPLASLPSLRSTRSARASSWDRTGGNRDFIVIGAGETANLADLDEPGVVRHIWMTASCDDRWFLRTAVLRAYWDGEEAPSVEVPFGDFFGIGHAETRNYWSLPLQMSPEDGRGFNCWFPMPFDRAKITMENASAAPLTLYFYIDYEVGAEPAPARSTVVEQGRFHAQWRRERPAGIDPASVSNEEYLGGGVNLTGDDNYVVLEATGRGHYVGCNLNVHNLRAVGTDVFNWYGEGDDMIFVDGEPFPPSLHGTGTEDYFNTAYSPSEAYSSPYHGIVLPGDRNWAGKIEHGHANRRSDDYSSTAYWYQAEPHLQFPTLLPVAARLPRRPKTD
jgi:hypothetical protein